jgi:hypothetical protein
MNTLWRTLHQYWLALRIWWRCKHDPHMSRRVAQLVALLQQDMDTAAVPDRLH